MSPSDEARLLAAGAEVVAVDALPEMLAGARRRAPDAVSFLVRYSGRTLEAYRLDHRPLSRRT